MSDVALDYHAQRDVIEDGDVLLWEGKGLVSRAIRWRTGGRFSHASVCVWVTVGGVRRLCVVEAREFVGIHAVPLSDLAREHSGEIAWFGHVIPEGHGESLPPLDRRMLVGYAASRVGRSYDYGAIMRIVRQTWPWSKVKVSRHDGEPVPRSAICSALVAAACRVGGGRDLVNGRADRETTPAQLEQSALLEYRGHLIWSQA